MNEQAPRDNHQNLPARIHSTPIARPTHSGIPRRSPQHTDKNSGITPGFILWVFRQWWAFVVPAGLLLAGIAAVVIIYFHVPEYRASAWIIIESSEPYIAFSQDSDSRNSDRYIQTQIELLRSPIVLGNIVSRPEIASLSELREEVDPIEHLQKHLTISQVGKSELHNIHYTSPFPENARAIVNAVVAEYLSSQTEENFNRTQRVIDLLEEERHRRSFEVERLRSRVMDLAKEISGTDPFGQGIVIDPEKTINRATTLAPALVEIDVNREVLKAEIQAFYESPALGPDPASSSGLLDLEIANHEGVREHEVAIAEIRSRIDEIKRVSRRWSSQPSYIRLKENLDRQQASLADLKAMLRKDLIERRRIERKIEREQAIASLEKELAQLDGKKKSLSKQYEEQLDDLKDGGAKSVQFEFAKAELDREEKIFELIASRKLALQTELRAPARVRLRKEADIPLQPIEPVPYKILLAGCLAALFAPLGLAVARELAMRRISSPEQLAQESKLRVLGEVARIPVRHVAGESNSLPNRVRQDMFVFTESIDSLRTSLDLSEYLNSHNVLAVTSAAPGEGKTSVATSLAESIARATNEPTLLVNADLRKREESILNGDESYSGLAEVLAGECSIDDAIHRVGESNTYVMPAGHAKVNPHRVVQAPCVRDLLDKLRPRFSAIVIDTPPILSASESLVFAKTADAVLFCTLRDVSRSRQVHAAVERLEYAGANVIGSVMNGTSIRHYGYSYGVYSNGKELEK